MIIARRNSQDFSAEIAHLASIENLFLKLGKWMQLVCAAGDAKLGYIENLQEAEYYIGI